MRTKCETVLARVALRWIPLLSRRAVVRWSRFWGNIAYGVCPRMRRVGLANLDLAFGDTKTPGEKRRILRRSFQSISLVILDAFWFARDSEARIHDHVFFDPCFDALFRAKPHICVTAHYGNWEVLGMAITARGFPLHSVAKPLKNPDVDDIFSESRGRTGQGIIPVQGAVRAMLRILQKGEKIALVLDQNTRTADGGVFVSFFDLPVPVSSAAAALAIKTGTDVFIGMMTPQPDGTYRGDFGLEIPAAPYSTMPKNEAILALTARITLELETFLRGRPDYWTWYYKRWKFTPPGADLSRYPFYAHGK